MDNEYRFLISPETEGERIDKCISLLVDTVSRSYIQKLLKDEKVFVNGKSVKSSYKVNDGDEIFFILPPNQAPAIEAEDLNLDILYEDSDVLVINKPKGMVVHPAAGHYSGTVVNGVMFHCGNELSGINGVLRPGIVHRIDMDTTGSLIICKNDISHNDIAAQLKEHSIHRVYHAICYGNIKEEEGTIEGSIGRHPNDRKKMAINVPGGKPAVTHFKVLEHFSNYTYVQCILETGRTHQIRVHMASIGHPLIGDTVYAGDRKCPFHLEGQTLHAMTLGFIQPTSKEYIEINAPLPEYFQHVLDVLRNKK